MTKLRHDHPSITTVDGRLATRGATNRPVIRVHSPASGLFPSDAIVRVICDERVKYARVVGDSTHVEFRNLCDTPANAREPGPGSDGLSTWMSDRNLAPGRTVHVDVVKAEQRFGLRGPGESARYESPDSPADSLQSIATEFFDPE